MFDRIVFDGAPYPQTVNEHRTVTEHRAPTDESVRLLDEFQKAAEKRIVESMKIENNEISGVIHRMAPAFDLYTHWKVVFKINGNVHTVDIKTDGDLDRHGQMTEIYKAVADEIALTLLKRITLGEGMKR